MIMHIYGVINPQYTDPSGWLSTLKDYDDHWYYKAGSYNPQVGDKIHVYRTDNKGIIATVLVTGRGLKDGDKHIQPICSDRNRRGARKQGYFCTIALDEIYDPPLLETKRRSDLFGKKQSTFKLDMEEYIDHVYNRLMEDYVEGDTDPFDDLDHIADMIGEQNSAITDALITGLILRRDSPAKIKVTISLRR